MRWSARAPDRHRGGWPAWVARGLWAALVVAALRLTVLYGMERFAHRADELHARIRLAAALPSVLVASAALGLAVLGAAAAVERLVRDSPLRWLLRAAIAAGGAAGYAALLTGRLFTDTSRLVGDETERGRQATTALGALSVALCLAFLSWTVLCERHGPGRPLRRTRARNVWLPASALLLPPLLLREVYGSMPTDMLLRDVVASLAAGGVEWTVEASHPLGTPSTGTLCPSMDYEVDGADMPALILPPPASVRVRVRPELGAVWLRARAGIDRSVLEADDAPSGSSIRFEARVDGRTVFEAAIPLEQVGRFRGTEWRAIAAGDGIPLRAGSEVVLSTAWIDADGRARVPERALAAGFGGLSFERRIVVPRTRSSPSAPSIVLVVMDTQRADRLSAYGYARPTSPRLERLAERGTLYEQAYATSSWTWPSTASILTGLQPQEHGVLSEASCFLADEHQTLAEALQRQGFTTAAWSGNGLIVPDKNFDQGFELFDHGKGAIRPSAVLVPPAQEWLRSVAGTRFFLYLHLADPHAPQVPLPQARARFAPDVPATFDPSTIVELARVLRGNGGRSDTGAIDLERCVGADVRRFVSDLYDACTWSGDHWLGELLDELERLGLDDETIVAYTSDHGEELFDHGLAAHGQSVYGELVRVPLVLAGPGIPAGARVTVPVSNRHLAPTLARIVGASVAGFPPDGLDLSRPALLASAPLAPVLFSTEHGWWNGRHRQPIYGLRRAEHVLHLAPRGTPWGVSETAPGEGEWRLFDLSRDPQERLDLTQREPEIAAELREALRTKLAELEARRTAPAVPAGTATLEHLRALGYVGDE